MQLDNIQFLCDTIDNGILLLDKEFNVLFWNKWLERRTNISFEQIENKNLGNFFPSLDKKRLKRKIDTSLKLNIATYYNTAVNKYLLEIKLNKITNKVFDNMQQAVTITPYDKEKGIVILYIYDNTLLFESTYTVNKAKTALEDKNKELNDSKSEIDLLLNTTMEAVLLYEDDKCKRVNAKALELFEYENEEEIKNKTIHHLVEESYLNLIKSSHEKPYEIKMIKKDNESFDALVQVKDAKLKNKTLKVLTVLDLTHLKEKDKILAEQAKMAALGEMIGNIAHQWRQPLSAICTITSGLQFQREMNLLKEDLLDKNLDDIVNLTTHLSQTINDFRNFMKKDKEKSEFKIKENIEKALSVIDELLKTRNIKIITNYENNFLLHNYSNELTQALLNIINNAKDALEPLKTNRKYIYIHTYEKNNEAYIEITDNALGIPKNIINKIFEPYFTTKNKDQGTGLGLYMTHQLIEKSVKGSLKVKNVSFELENEPFEGACFTIKFPLN